MNANKTFKNSLIKNASQQTLGKLDQNATRTRAKKYALPFVVVMAVLLAVLAACSATASAHACDCPNGDKFHGTLNGGIYFEFQDCGCDAQTETVTFNNVPDKDKVKFARVYTNIWGGSPSGGGEFNITVNGNPSPTYTACDPCPQETDCHPTQEQACNTTDVPGEVHDYITGCQVHFITYNATPYIVTGTNTVTMKTHGLTTCPNGSSPFDGRIYSIALLVVYEDANIPEITYWINEGTRYMDNGSACCWDGVNFPEVFMYFNGSAYPGSVSDLKYWTTGDPNGPRVNPEFNGNSIGACDYKYGTNFQRWDNIPVSYLAPSSNLFYYYAPYADYERINAAVLMLNSSGHANLAVTDISPGGLYADPDETGRYANVINATVVNYGKTAYFFDVTLYVNDILVDVKRVTNLGEGESRVVSFLWVPNQTVSYTLKVTADVENIVKETDETNNSKTLPVTVTEAPPPEWQSQSSSPPETIPNGGTIELRAQGKAGTGLYNAILATDETGDWKNCTDYGSPMDLVSYSTDSITHTSDADWNNQTIEKEPVYNGKPLLIVSSGNVKLAQLTAGTENLALDVPEGSKPASASSEKDGYPASDANDGLTSTRWNSHYPPEYPEWWCVDLGEVTDIAKLYLEFSSSPTYKCNYAIHTSNDNETWTKQIQRGWATGDTYTDLDWSCCYINVTFENCEYSPRITELEAYGPGDYASNGTLTSSTIETSNPIVTVIPIWNSTEPAETNLSVNISVDNGATWKDAVNSEELMWDYNVHNTKLKYKVLFETTNLSRTPVLHDISLNYTTKDPIESEWLWSNFTWHNSSITNKTIHWKIYYEDMLGKTNCTDVMSFNVTPDTTPPAKVTGVTVTTVSSSQLDVSWTANTESDLDHYNVYRSETAGFTPGTGNLVASPTTNYYSDTGLTASTTYYYRVTAVDTSGNEGTPSDEASGTTGAEQVVEDKAKEDIPVKGDVTGTYVNTHASDNVREAIKEVLSTGKPANRYSYLEHKWSIDVTGDSDFVFYLEAHHSQSNDGDDFEFAYSTDDSTYTLMVTVIKTADDGTYQTYTFTEAISGTVYIRVQDTNRNAGKQELNTVYIDHMYIKSKSGSPPSYGVTVTIDETSQKVAPGESTTYTVRVKNTGGLDASYNVAMTGTAVDESTITVSPLSWNTGTLAPNVENVQTVTVSTTSSTPETTYTLTATATCEQDGSVKDSATSELVVSSATNAMHVNSIDMSLKAAGPNTNAVALITIVDANGVAVEGAAVYGHWSDATSDTDSGTTDASGQVSLSSDKVKNPPGGTTFTFTVDDVVLTGWIYDSATNVETSDSISV